MQAATARREQGFLNALPTGPERATVRKLAHTVSGNVVSVRHDSCNHASNALDAHGLHWRSKRRQARAYMDTHCWSQGVATLMHHTLPTGCWDGPNTAMLRTLTAYYENAGPQSEPTTHVQCYRAMQAWCRAERKKKAAMPDKGTVMMLPPTEFLFHNWAPHYEAGPALKGEYVADRTGVAEHRRANRHVNGRGQLLEHHYVIVPKAVASKVIQGVHSYSHPGVDKTLELLHRQYKFHGYTPSQLPELVENVVQRCDTCQTRKPRCGGHPETRHYYPIPKYPFASVAMDIVHPPTCEVRKGYTVDCCFVIVDGATGYVLAIPTTLKGLGARKLAELSLEKCVFFTSVPNEILRDSPKYFNNKFVTTLWSLAGISTHESVIYDHKTNGRAERAVKSVVETLRVYLQETNTPTSQWYSKLPMALWGLSDLPGTVAPYSPHRLWFGRDPFEFGDMLPIVEENGCKDALVFFMHLGREREEVQQKLTAIHEKHEKEFRKTHPEKFWEVGDRIWVRNLPKGEDRHFDKLARIWSGPYEVLQIMGGGRYRVATAQGPQILGIGRLKLALPLLSGVKLKCGHHTLRPSPEHDETGLVEDVVDFKEVPSTRGNSKVHEWLVNWRGHQEWTWETRDQFVHHVCDPRGAYNAKHDIRLPM